MTKGWLQWKISRLKESVCMQHSELSVQRQKNTTENSFVFPLLLRRECRHYTAAHSLVTMGFYFPVGSRGFLRLLVAVALHSPGADPSPAPARPRLQRAGTGGAAGPGLFAGWSVAACQSLCVCPHTTVPRSAALFSSTF